MNGDYTFFVAMAAGLISFLSPCVLPLVPAYLGQLTSVAVAAQGEAAGARPSRWAAVRHSLLFVAGFGTVFTLLGVTAAFAGGAIADYIKPLRTIGGVVLVVMGLSLAGILKIPMLERTWRPLDAGASASLATTTGGMSLAPTDGGGMGGRVGSRLVAGRTGFGAAFVLGAVFAIGWTPCIGAILGGILTMAATSEGKLQRSPAAGGLHDRAGGPVRAHRRLLRSIPQARPVPRPARAGRLADRRSCSWSRSAWQ